MTSNIIGKRIQISGSAHDEINPKNLELAHRLVHKLFVNIIASGGGLVLGIGEDPLRKNEPKIPIIFNWQILEVLCDFTLEDFLKWPISEGAPIVLVAFSDWEERVPDHRKELCEILKSKDFIQLIIVPSELTYGGVLRKVQSKYGDILISLGGGTGVHDSIHLYKASKKHVIPLDISLHDLKRTASEIHSRRLLETPAEYLEYSPAHKATLAFSALSIKAGIADEEKYISSIIDFMNNLRNPIAFYVRLMNKTHDDYVSVENYFRNVIDPVISVSGYEKFESGQDPSDELFLNTEIFRKIQHSSLVLIDLTGIRPNCCIELGFALGLGKKIILTAKEKTSLPFDSKMISCHFWGTDRVDKDRINDLTDFMKININRHSIVHQDY